MRQGVINDLDRQAKKKELQKSREQVLLQQEKGT